MNVLIVGGGGREHALAWKAAQSANVEQVFVAPGNAGTALDDGLQNVSIRAGNIDELVDFAARESIDLTIIGPEVPLVEGICDRFAERGLRCFGPSAAAARLEGSKAYMKAFLERHAIPTAAHRSFRDLDEAIDYVRGRGAPIVVKADGLAAGKGVVVCTSVAEAEDAVRDMLAKRRFGDAGNQVVVEEFLGGEEASFIAMVDGEHILPLASSQDHKARDDGDLGPNTGGMGAYSPAPVVTPEVHDRIMETIMRPTVAGLAADGTPYTGFLYAGVMIDETGAPKVLEFNCRFGDPETQPVLMRLNSDLVALCNAAIDGRLDTQQVHWDERVALGVVMAAGGYPGAYESGDPITGLPTGEAAATKVFHAGTRLEDSQVVTSGGRVLCVVALGDSVTDAKSRAYQLVDTIHWERAYFRRDIGYRAVSRET